MIREIKNALSLTLDRSGNEALKITKTDDKNLYVNFPSTDFLDVPESPKFSLLLDNVEFEVDYNTPIYASMDTIFEDTGFYGYASNDWVYDDLTVTTSSRNTKVEGTGTYTYKYPLNEYPCAVEFEYTYDGSVDNTKQGFELVDVFSTSFNDLVGSTSGTYFIRIETIPNDTVIVYVDGEEAIHDETVNGEIYFRFYLTDDSFRYSHFKMEQMTPTFSDTATSSDYNNDYEIIYANNETYGINRTKDATSSTWTADCDGEIIPNVLLHNGLELNIHLDSYSGDCGLVYYSKKFNKRHYLSFTNVDVPQSTSLIRFTYDGNKTKVLLNGVVVDEVSEYLKLEDSIRVGFYVTENSSFTYHNLRLGYRYDSYTDAGFIATNNPNWHYSDNTLMNVNDRYTSFAPYTSKGTGYAYPCSNRATNTPVFLLGDCEITFDYINDGGDGSDKVIEFINSLGNRHNQIYIKDLFKNELWELRQRYEIEKNTIENNKECLEWIEENGNTNYGIGLIINDTTHKVTVYTTPTNTLEYDMYLIDEEYIVPDEVLIDLYDPYKTWFGVPVAQAETNIETYLNDLTEIGMFDADTYDVREAVKEATPTMEINDASLKFTVTGSTLKAYRKIEDSYVEQLSTTLNFQSSTDYYVKLKQKNRDGTFQFKNFVISNDVYSYGFDVICRGFDKQGKIYRGTEYDVGVWQQTKHLTVLTSERRGKVTFSDVPSNVESIDFEIKLKDNIPSIILSQFMLYEGDYETNHQTDTRKSIYDSANIDFNRSFYANLYNEEDEQGISVIRPYMDSIKLTDLPPSETTVLYPYNRKCKIEDSPSRVSIEYLKANNQIININWK